MRQTDLACGHGIPGPSDRLQLANDAHRVLEAPGGTAQHVGVRRPVLAEDPTGRGHVTRVVGDQARDYPIVPLADA